MTVCPHCGGQLKCQVSFVSTYDCIIDGDRIKPDDNFAPETECLIEQVFCKDCGKVLEMDTDHLYVDDVIIAQQGE